MLPSDILGIIDSYNEHHKGFFLVLFDVVYWFNGKRYEKWCLIPDKFSYWSLLLYSDGYLKVYGKIYRNLIWQPSNCFHSNNETNVTVHSVNYTLKYLRGGEFILFDKDNIKLNIPRKKSPNVGIYGMVHESILYICSSMKNEKYDFRLCKWSEFAYNMVLTNVINLMIYFL